MSAPRSISRFIQFHLHSRIGLRGLVALLGLAGCAGVALPGCGTGPSHNAPTTPSIQITKLPVNFATRTFDAAAPPPEMPPLGAGEVAVCDSSFAANASLSGKSHRIDGAHALLTITGVNVTLEARVTIWLPAGASDHVIEHEQGHRQISEYYYKTADQLARRIAETYAGREVPITGNDLDSEASSTLGRLAKEFTAEYDRQLNPDPAQQLYDTLTDHSRNQTPVNDAIALAIKDAEVAAPRPVADASN